MEALNAWLEHWYPLYWSGIFVIEMFVGIATLVILIIEYHYDREWNESRSKRKRVTKNKVKVVIDSEGNARISEAPKDVDVSIEHEGGQK